MDQDTTTSFSVQKGVSNHPAGIRTRSGLDRQFILVNELLNGFQFEL